MKATVELPDAECAGARRKAHGPSAFALGCAAVGMALLLQACASGTRTTVRKRSAYAEASEASASPSARAAAPQASAGEQSSAVSSGSGANGGAVSYEAASQGSAPTTRDGAAAASAQALSAPAASAGSDGASGGVLASFERFHQRFPGVSREQYLAAAQGKPHPDFCMFRDDPAQACADYGDYENDHGRKKTAGEAYRAALLTESYNSAQLNIRLWGGLAQLAIEAKDNYNGQVYLTKILDKDPANKWAKQRLSDILKRRYE